MAQTATSYGLNFRDYWRIFRKRKGIIILSILLASGFTYYRVRQQVPLYRTFSTVKLEQRQTIAGAILESTIPWSTGDPLESMAQIIESQPIAEMAARHLGFLREDMTPEAREEVIEEVQGALSTERVGLTNLIRISAVHTDPPRAMEIANGTAEVFVQWDLNEKNKQARKVREFIEEQLATVEKKLHASEEAFMSFKGTHVGTETISPLSDQLTTFKMQLAELQLRATEKHPDVVRLKQRVADIETQIASIPGGETEYSRVVREMKLNEQLYTLFKQKFEEARIAEAEKISDVSIVDYAKLPTAPASGPKELTFLLGSISGLLFGLILAFVFENIDTSLSTIEGVETLLSVPVLAVIPRTGSGERKNQLFPFSLKKSADIDHKARLIVHHQPKSSVAESYRSLRTNLKFSEGTMGRSLLVTSAGPQEGKTTVLINLGLTIAQMGSKVLLVDSDLRRPSINKTFGLNREPGLYDVLSGEVPWQEAVQGLSDMLLGGMTLDEVSKTPGLDHFFILSTGRIPLNPAELLGSREMENLILDLRKNFEVVLYDTPPVLPVTDAALLAPKMDHVILVYEIGRTARNALLRAKQQIESLGGKVVGIVLNHIKEEVEPDTAYTYYHYKYYGPEKEKKEKERRVRI